MTLEDSQSGVDEFGVVFDEDAWPLLYVRFPPKGLSDESLEAFLARYTAYLNRQERFAAINDSRSLLKVINAKQRRRLVAWFDSVWNIAREYNVASAILLQSAAVRGALTAVFWMKPPPTPSKSFGSLVEAAPWLRERMQEAGIEVTAEMERLLSGRV